MLITLTKNTWVELGGVGFMRHDPANRSFRVIGRTGAVMLALVGEEAEEAAGALQSFVLRMEAHADMKVAAIMDRPGG